MKQYCFNRKMGLIAGTVLTVAIWGAAPLYAQDAIDPQPPAEEAPSWYSLHIQGTYTTMGHGPFHSAIPNGSQSMLNEEQMAETADVTLYAGVRLGNVELYYNPEMDQGYGPSSTYGVAGYPSGEAYKAGQYAPYYRAPRLFGRYILDLSGETVNVDDAINQLAGSHQSNNITFTFGKFGIPDIFDTNSYAHDPKNDFLNWSVVESGAFDYGAELWGYTYGGAVEWNQDWWTLRAGLFDMSRQPNGAELTVNFQNNESIVEAEERHELFDQPGKVKILGYLMSAKMGSYSQAITAAGPGGTPDTAAVLQYHLRPGGGINMEQQITPGIGVFAKYSANDGSYGEYDFTDINRSLSGGISIKGDRWGRDNDAFGVAGVMNDISTQAQKYFAAGGMGGLVGDGALPSYSTEKIIEAYYKITLMQPNETLTLDYQHVQSPGYDPVRGPVDFIAFRLHLEY